jgi:hypothetical protein
MRTVSHRRGNVVRHKKSGDLTSATGHSRRSDRAPFTSGLPQLADILRVGRHVSNVPEAVILALGFVPSDIAPAVFLMELRTP